MTNHYEHLSYLLSLSSKLINFGKLHMNRSLNKHIIQYRNKHRYQIQKHNSNILKRVQKEICKKCMLYKVEGYTSRKRMKKNILKDECMMQK